MAKPRLENKAARRVGGTCHSDTLFESSDWLETNAALRMDDAGTDFRAAQPAPGGKS